MTAKIVNTLTNAAGDIAYSNALHGACFFEGGTPYMKVWSVEDDEYYDMNLNNFKIYDSMSASDRIVLINTVIEVKADTGNAVK